MQRINGKKIRDALLTELKERIAALPFVPVFCDLVVGEDPASLQYVQMKERMAQRLGIEVVHAQYPDTYTTTEIVQEVRRISALPRMSGLIVQLPLPASVVATDVLNAIPSRIDVDSLGSATADAFYANTPVFMFPTAAAVMMVLDSLNISLTEKNIVIVGEGMLVGKPVAHLLKERGCSVTIVGEATPHPETIFKTADILISATGNANLITKEVLKEGVVVIDAGTSESGGGIIGDVDTESVSTVAGMIAPVPGGVGPVTVACLMHNVVVAAERQAGIQ